MTQTGVTNAVVNTMLAWLKGLAAWVLRLFNLSGSGGSPLSFMADNWKMLLAVLLIVGVAADIIVWIIRWRPHWVWFRKKRIVINDDNFFKGEDEIDDRPRRRGRRSNDWVDHEYVVPSTIVKRRKTVRPGNEEHGEKEETHPSHTDVFSDSRFDVNAKQHFTDRYESEVFNVEDLHHQGARRTGHAERTGQGAHRKPSTQRSANRGGTASPEVRRSRLVRPGRDEQDSRR